MFVGRESELDQLDAYATDAMSGPACAVLVEGQAGVGKSALLRKWLSRPVFDKFTVIRAVCDPSEQDWPLGVITQLSSHFPADMPVEPRAAVTDAPFVHGARLRRMLDQLHERGPVALVVDDVQWCDEISFKALGYALRRLGASSIIAVLAMRTGTSGSDDSLRRVEEVRRLISERSTACKLSLKGLGRAEVRAFVQQATGYAVGDAVVERLLAHTDGNPLYLQAVLVELTQEQLTDSKGILPIPSTFTQTVHHQLSGLPEPARRLVEAAAIMNSKAPLNVVAHVAGLENAAEALESALEVGLLRWWPEEPATPIDFNHILQRDAVIAAIAPTRRRGMHAAAARHLGRNSAWRHRVAAAGGPDAGLCAELCAEADRLQASGAIERAATLTLWAADLAASRADRETHLLTGALHLMWAERFGQVEALYRELQACSPSPLRDLALGCYAISRNAVSEAVSLLSRARSAQLHPDQAWIAELASYWLGFVRMLQVTPFESVTELQKALNSSIRQDVRLRSRFVVALNEGMIHGPSAAARYMKTSIAPSLTDLTPATAAFPLCLRGVIRGFAARTGGSLVDLTTALHLSHTVGSPISTSLCHTWLAVGYYMKGTWDEAAIHARNAIISANEGNSWDAAFAYSCASWTAAGRGQWDRAKDLLRTARQQSQRGSPGYCAPPLAIAEAVLAQAQADYSAMVRALDQLFELPEQGMVNLLQAYWRPLYTEALIATNDLDRAQVNWLYLSGLADEIPLLRTVTGWTAGQLAEAQGDLEAAHRYYENSLSTAGAPDTPPLHRARLEQAQGRLLAALGDNDHAEALLSLAARRLSRLDAQPFLARCQRDLDDVHHSGAAAAPAKGTDTFSQLSVRESDIVRLVAHGLTNKEIAAELYVSVKTVEYHLSRVFGKLGLTSRRQLRSYLANTPKP